MGAPPIEHGALAIVGGRIEAIGTAESVLGARPDQACLEYPSGIAMPGLVNAHTHLGHDEVIPEYAPFDVWIERMADRVRSASAAPDPKRVEDTVARAAARMAAGGVTTLGDSGPFPEAAAAIARAGLRGRFYLELFGPDPKSAPDALAAAVRQLELTAGALDRGADAAIALGLAPHAPYTVSIALLALAQGVAAQRGWPLAIHLAESREESAYLSGLGPLADRLTRRGIATPALGSPVDWLAQAGALGGELLLAHLTQAAPPDVERLAATRGATAVLCPTANAFLGHGRPPVAALLDSGVRLALGTDGVASNPRQDLFEEMRQLLMLARPSHPISTARALEIATRGGACALGLGAHAGALAPGLFADLAVIEPPCPMADPIDTVVLTTVREHVAFVVAGGRILHSTRGLPW